MSIGTGMTGRHLPVSMKDEWLTPPEILSALGAFDLDPCAPIERPWPTARMHFTIRDNGLLLPWMGRVWLNPPYGNETAKWLGRLAEHGDGIALIFARTETDAWARLVWGRASAILFLEGRLDFYHVTGVKARGNAGAPSALIAYGDASADVLASSGIPGALVAGWERLTPGNAARMATEPAEAPETTPSLFQEDSATPPLTPPPLC